MGEKVSGNLFIIGGGEDKTGSRTVLGKMASLIGGGELFILTTATEEPEETGDLYRRVFGDLGLDRVTVAKVNTRASAMDRRLADDIESAGGIFFTGGDQLRITSLLGGTPVDAAIREAYRRGALIAGTSAGASAMSDIMIVDGAPEEAPKLNTIRLSPGLGFFREVVIDQHFAQRGRIGRLMSAVAQNPYILGIGIDEDTAIVVHPEGWFQVVGSQTVTVIDGRELSHTNPSESNPDRPLALLGLRVHALPEGYTFELYNRRPGLPGAMGEKAYMSGGGRQK